VLYARVLTYMFSDESDVELLTPSFLFPDIHQLAVPDCDFSDAEAVKRCLRFLQNLLYNLRKHFRQDVSGCVGDDHGQLPRSEDGVSCYCR
jgi:hypothetical protein